MNSLTLVQIGFATKWVKLGFPRRLDLEIADKRLYVHFLCASHTSSHTWGIFTGILSGCGAALLQ